MNNDSDTDSYPLDTATSELMQETMLQWNAIRAFREGVISLFIRQQKLGKGNWHVADNQKELVRVDGRDRVSPKVQSQKTT